MSLSHTERSDQSDDTALLARVRARLPELIERLFALLDDEEVKPATALSVIRELMAMAEEHTQEAPQPIEVIVRVEE